VKSTQWSKVKIVKSGYFNLIGLAELTSSHHKAQNDTIIIYFLFENKLEKTNFKSIRFVHWTKLNLAFFLHSTLTATSLEFLKPNFLSISWLNPSTDHIILLTITMSSTLKIRPQSSQLFNSTLFGIEYCVPKTYK